MNYKKLFPLLCGLMVTFLCATPIIGALAPRAFAWWPAVLGLAALPLGDKTKEPLWLTACVPLWIGLFTLYSILWAAYPDLQFDMAIERLPMMYGLSLTILGLGRLRDEVWERALPKMGLVFAAAILVAFVEYSFDFPIFRLYNHWRGMDDARNVIQAVMNRGFTVLSLFAIPALWVLWHQGRERLVLFIAVFMTCGIAITEASATFLALVVAEIVFALAWRWPAFVRYLIAIGGAMKILLMPLLAYVMFMHMPNWHALQSASTGGRLEIWHGLAKLVFKAPFAGYGYEITRFIPLPIAHLYFEYPTVLHPHNAALQLWMEYGAVGAVLGCAGWWLWSMRSRSAPALALMAMIAVIGSLSYGLWQGTWLGLIVFTLFYWRAAATSFGNKIQ